MERNVLCMKWGKAYAADYVNVLASAVRKNLSVDHRFVCFTDDTSGISPEIETFPIPDMGLSPSSFRFGAWPKIALFKPKLYGLSGRALFIDLDSMICGDLESMFDHPGEMVMIEEWKRPIDHLRPFKVPRGISGVLAFNIGSVSYIYDQLAAKPTYWPSTIRNDQRFIWHHKKKVHFWPSNWVISFKRHLLRPPLINKIMQPRSPPRDTRILAFHGRPRPAELVPDQQQRWGDFWRSGYGAVSWFREYWLNNGGNETIEAIGPRRDWRGRPIN